MELVKDYSAAPNTNKHFIASLVCIKRAEKDMIMTLDTPEERFESMSG
ncbi:hypothetical protein BAE44_0022476 [Dichanthelium oligosanthes]|uniref:Uncharacterized protein n=1 Tax=Dichanthelium oligosanthes TaxID=888268 RepID=A0A1E5UUM2_9POAL|nr:hypothetical protein BAE44_0022476 [Dichanthelium oligosanthes]